MTLAAARWAPALRKGLEPPVGVQDVPVWVQGLFHLASAHRGARGTFLLNVALKPTQRQMPATATQGGGAYKAHHSDGKSPGSVFSWVIKPRPAFSSAEFKNWVNEQDFPALKVQA